jgi:hypothetical protein
MILLSNLSLRRDGGGRVYNQVLLQSNGKHAVPSHQSGVSLHGHTRHSQESLRFIGKILEHRSLSRRWFEDQKVQCVRITGIPLDLERAYWTPPLCERLAYEVESRQIEGLGLRPMVSLTDHDTIEACVLLCADPAFRNTPISTEWTVPFGRAVFHFGVHNLPHDSAHALMATMRGATAMADEERIFALFAELCSMPSVLVVFNHPLWNFYDIPRERFDFELRRFLESANRYVHAFEINGMRGHAENREVIQMAADWDQLVISGGDRHGCEPNASLNLTNAGDFAEFVDEIREARRSTVLIMPQYAEPLGWRFYRNFTHVIGEYPGHPEGRRRWDERIFHPDRAGQMAPIVKLWKEGGPPEFLRAIFAAAMMAAHVPLRGFLRRWMNRENESLSPSGANPQTGAISNSNTGAGAAFGERTPEASLNECLYVRGEPAAD